MPSSPSWPTEHAELLGEGEARTRLLMQVYPLEPETLPLLQAADRYTARAGYATQSLPAFDNSAMDGYVLVLPEKSPALPAGTRLEVVGQQAAGSDQRLSVKEGQAIRIFTGAPIPQGANSVVMQEDVKRTGNIIVLQASVAVGDWVRRAGGDLAHGQLMYEAGCRLTPQRLGLLASQGLREVAVGGKPRVAILATGDELRPAGEPLGSGEIYESNGTLLGALAASLGAETIILERARDDRSDLDAKLSDALSRYDALVVAGGVSVGERDFVKESLVACGTRLDLWRVRIQPGKPFLYGTGPTGDQRPHGGAHVFGLPGNPVSAFVTFLLFVRPALLRLMGAADDELALPSFPATAGVDLVQKGDRPHYLRGTIDHEGRFFPSGKQESHALFALSRSHALVRVEPNTTVARGDSIRAYLWSL